MLHHTLAVCMQSVSMICPVAPEATAVSVPHSACLEQQVLQVRWHSFQFLCEELAEEMEELHAILGVPWCAQHCLLVHLQWTDHL